MAEVAESDDSGFPPEQSMESVIDAFNPLHNKLNWLLVALPLAVIFNFQHNLTMAFLFSMIAIMPLAFLMGERN